MEILYSLLLSAVKMLLLSDTVHSAVRALALKTTNELDDLAVEKLIELMKQIAEKF